MWVVFLIHCATKCPGMYACFCHTFVCRFFSYICMRFCIRVFVIHLNAGFFHTFVCVFVCVFFSYICMQVFFIHLYACLYACFSHTFVCVFLSYICMRFCMRVFVIHSYACLFHTFLHLYLGWPWRSGECGRPITRGLAVQSPLTVQQKNYQCTTHSHDSSPETFLLACFFHTFVCGFFSYICMRFFFIHLYACLYVFFS